MDQNKSMIEWRRSRVRWQSAMAGLLALVCLCLGAGALDAVRAQDDNLPQDTFLVSYIRSQPSLIPSFNTVISLTNINDAVCSATVIWRANDGTEICTTASDIPANQTHHHCSSQSPEASRVTVACHQVCNAASNSIEGHAVIQTAGDCGVRMGVDAKVYSAFFLRNADLSRIISTESIGFHTVRVYRYDGVNLTD